ncbi:MAG: bifunctional metallophosphatase/5'-nucleotidase, partial [Spirochaetes bacterium]|nr:bifunctional metallophosphatase/5'-nucleotidase [Spirochaetota bacterium]
ASRTYTVAMTDFLYSGGDGYGIFTGKPAERTGILIRDLLVDTIRKRGTVDTVTDGRIRRLD